MQYDHPIRGNMVGQSLQRGEIGPNRTPLTYKIGHSKKLAFTNRFYLRKFLNSIGLLAKKEKNHNNVT